MGSRDDGSRGYGQDDEYATADGYGGYPQGGAYPGYETSGPDDGYGPPAEYGYRQPGEYGQPAGYGDGGNGYRDDRDRGAGYGETPGYGQSDGYPRGSGYAPGDEYAAGNGYAPGDGYGQSGGYPHDGYGQSGGYPHDGYARGDGYPPDGGYGRPQGYGGNGQEAFGRPAIDRPAIGYAGSGGYPALPGGRAPSGGYPALPAGSSGHSGDYPVHSGDYPIQGNGGSGSAGRADIAGRYAGSDWYGGQPGAASGSGFADTGTYTMDARIIDSYGTGPRAAEYGTGPYDQGETGVPQGLVHTGQQERYDDEYEPYPGYGDQERLGDRRGHDTGYAGDPARGYDDYDEPAGFGAHGYDPAAGSGVPGGYDGYADEDDPYGDRYGDGTAPQPAVAAGGKRTKNKSGKGRGKRPLLLAGLAVVTVAVLGAAAYVFVLKPKPSAGGSPAAAGPLPTTGSTSAATAACVKQFGTYCHIELRADDPTPLTLDELFPPAFLNETDHASFTRAVTRLDTKCANAVIGPDLIKALQNGKCTQVLRASYVSGDSTIMGTIGVVNLETTNEAHYAGKVVGANDFVMPLSTSKGITSKLGKGTGVVEAEFKGHYLILTWAEFTNTNAPKTKAQDQQLEQFENDLVAGTANVSLSQRMVTGKPATAGAAG